jgi:hypothetical protein
VPPLYKRPGNHWKPSGRVNHEPLEEEEEEHQPPWKTGPPKSLKDVLKKKSKRPRWK